MYPFPFAVSMCAPLPHCPPSPAPPLTLPCNYPSHCAVSLSTIESVLSAPLPRAYDDPSPTLGLGARPSDPSPTPLLVGRNAKVDRLPAAVQAMHKQLQEAVLAPLEQWIGAYHAIKVRF